MTLTGHSPGLKEEDAMQQFYHQSLGHMFDATDVRGMIRQHYQRVSPGSEISYHRTELNNPHSMIVCVDGRDVGHIFGKGIAG